MRHNKRMMSDSDGDDMGPMKGKPAMMKKMKQGMQVKGKATKKKKRPRNLREHTRSLRDAYKMKY